MSIPFTTNSSRLRDLADALVRETIQNSLDARVPRPDAVRENWDVKRNRPKRGSTTESRPGNIRRLITSVQQLDFNYDLYGMRAEEILQLLPLEFDAWKPAPLLRRGPSPGATRHPLPATQGEGPSPG